MREKRKVEISKIDINIGDKTVSLNPEEAKELKKILNEMFEEASERVVHEHRYWWNWPWYSNPVIVPTITTPHWTVSGTGTTGYCTDTVTLALTGETT